MRPNIKKWSKRKIYCRKRGGGAPFRFKGGKKSPRATSNFIGRAKQIDVKENVKSRLSKLGFRIMEK